MKPLLVALAQISPVWLNKKLTIEKICDSLKEAGDQKADLVLFGEGLLPGYPFWLALTNGAEWNSPIQKELHAHYIEQSVVIENGDLDPICEHAKSYKMAIYLGMIERAKDRGSHSLYCTLTYIDSNGIILSTHRKLQPTYDERLTWAPGDGNGLQVHRLKDFTVGGLNCWENWMPLPRAALYGMGENLHVAVWPGSIRNTNDITRYIALESRSYVVSVSGLMSINDFPDSTPYVNMIKEKSPDVLADGGSCIAGPDGNWIIEPIVDKEGLFTAELDLRKVFEERQNFDPSGHYSRPDVTKLTINRNRQSIIELE